MSESPFSQASRPPIVAHRGASAREAENTLEAFELAMASGAEAVEFDVRMTADGTPIVMHDAGGSPHHRRLGAREGPARRGDQGLARRPPRRRCGRGAHPRGGAPVLLGPDRRRRRDQEHPGRARLRRGSRGGRGGDAHRARRGRVLRRRAHLELQSVLDRACEAPRAGRADWVADALRGGRGHRLRVRARAGTRMGAALRRPGARRGCRARRAGARGGHADRHVDHGRPVGGARADAVRDSTRSPRTIPRPWSAARAEAGLA